jgi:hypothetical protein
MINFKADGGTSTVGCSPLSVVKVIAAARE